MAAEEKQDPPKRRGSCLGKLATLITFAGVAGLGVAVYFIARPQDMSDLKGTSPSASTKTRSSMPKAWSLPAPRFCPSSPDAASD